MKNKDSMLKGTVAVILSLSPFTFHLSTVSAQDYSEYILAVDEYVPAPGQFVHVYPEYEDGDDAAAMADKCTSSIAANADGLISLGGYGGYITFHFDHSIANVAGEYDFFIKGNASRASTAAYYDIGGSCEPGIVMVSRDDNANGLPDDTWYELSGSADTDSVGKVVYGYEITYRYAAMSDVPWTDNQGQSGTVDRNNYHQQEYYPLWLDTVLTFSGTLLPPNAIETSGEGTMWIQLFYDYGYVDNKPNSMTDYNSFNIEWAVDDDRQPVDLDRIDFIRVYTALNQKCGWIGETSTEVCNAWDLHLDESLSLMTDITTAGTDATPPAVVARYTVGGTKIASPSPGINILRMSDGTVRKIISPTK